MRMLKKLAGVAAKLKSRLRREYEYLGHVLQSLIFITIFDEICYVKLIDKRELMRSVLSRKHHHD